MYRRLGPLLLSAALAACASAADSSDPIEPEGTVVDARLGETFRLKAGGTARLDGGIQVFFRGGSNDSRCPSDVTCVWSGDATLHLRATVGRADWTPLELHTHVMPHAGDFYGHVLTVVDLKPYPKSTDRLSAGDYVAVLRVD